MQPRARLLELPSMEYMPVNRQAALRYLAAELYGLSLMTCS